MEDETTETRGSRDDLSYSRKIGLHLAGLLSALLAGEIAVALRIVGLTSALTRQLQVESQQGKLACDCLECLLDAYRTFSSNCSFPGGNWLRHDDLGHTDVSVFIILYTMSWTHARGERGPDSSRNKRLQLASTCECKSEDGSCALLSLSKQPATAREDKEQGGKPIEPIKAWEHGGT